MEVAVPPSDLENLPAAPALTDRELQFQIRRIVKKVGIHSLIPRTFKQMLKEACHGEDVYNSSRRSFINRTLESALEEELTVPQSKPRKSKGLATKRAKDSAEKKTRKKRKKEAELDQAWLDDEEPQEEVEAEAEAEAEVVGESEGESEKAARKREKKERKKREKQERKEQEKKEKQERKKEKKDRKEKKKAEKKRKRLLVQETSNTFETDSLEEEMAMFMEDDETGDEPQPKMTETQMQERMDAEESLAENRTQPQSQSAGKDDDGSESDAFDHESTGPEVVEITDSLLEDKPATLETTDVPKLGAQSETMLSDLTMTEQPTATATAADSVEWGKPQTPMQDSPCW